MKPLSGIRPGEIFVVNRDRTKSPFEPGKIAFSVFKAFIADVGKENARTDYVRDIAHKISVDVFETLKRRMHSGGLVHIEEIQDLTELGLLRGGEYGAGRAFLRLRQQSAPIAETVATSDPDDSGFSL